MRCAIRIYVLLTYLLNSSCVGGGSSNRTRTKTKQLGAGRSGLYAPKTELN